MADMGAVQRAAQGGQPPQGQPPQGPEGAPSENVGIEAIATELTGVKGFIDAQMKQGNPGAEPAMAALQQLVQAMSAMSGEGAPQGPEKGPSQGVPLQQQGIPL